MEYIDKIILIITNKWDISVDYVINILNKSNQSYIRLNTEDLPSYNVYFSLQDRSYKLTSKIKSKNLFANIKSIWIRRPEKPLEVSNDPVVSYFVTNQWKTLIESLYSFPDIYWINFPYNNTQAENKITQLRIANSLGLKIPITLISNNKRDIINFFHKLNGKIVAKALNTPLLEGSKDDFFIFTNIINSINEISKNEFSITPTIFQELLQPKIDYRLTIVNEKSFAVKIEFLNKDDEVDWRITKDNIHFIPVTLPPTIINKCLNLMKKFGLQFGAIDLIEYNGEFYFIEINPNGEWGWLQKQLGLPIAESIADCLINKGDSNAKNH